MARARYKLDDAEALHRKHPRTFSIPRSDQRGALAKGAVVKLVFRAPRRTEVGAERMWCIVEKRQGRGYVGRLDNDPVYLTNLKAGDRIEFQPRHVAAIYETDEPKLPALVGVGLDVLHRGLWPAWVARLARRDRDGKHDSGWRVFSAGEARAGAEVRSVSADALFRSWAVLDSVVEGGGDGVWRWDKGAAEFRRDDDGALPARLLAAAAEGLGRVHRPAPPADHQVIITRRALVKRPLCAQRLAPSKGAKDDSGWCIFVGDEPQRYLDDAKNSAVVPIARVIHLYPYFERVLGEPGKKMWRWDDELGDWRDTSRRAAAASKTRH